MVKGAAVPVDKADLLFTGKCSGVVGTTDAVICCFFLQTPATMYCTVHTPTARLKRRASHLTILFVFLCDRSAASVSLPKAHPIFLRWR